MCILAQDWVARVLLPFEHLWVAGCHPLFGAHGEERGAAQVADLGIKDDRRVLVHYAAAGEAMPFVQSLLWSQSDR